MDIPCVFPKNREFSEKWVCILYIVHDNDEFQEIYYAKFKRIEARGFVDKGYCCRDIPFVSSVLPHLPF